jgi:hypothetical protein
MRPNPISLLPVLLCLTANAFAQSAPPFVVQGPTIIQSAGCQLTNENFGGGTLTTACVSISYDQSQPTSESIAQNRYVLVPRGNLLFQFPLVSNLSASHGHLNVDYNVIVTVIGPNPSLETQTNSGSVTLNGKGSVMLQIPVTVDWAESVVQFQINLEQEILNGPCDPKPNCVSASGQFTGPDLSQAPLGLSFTPAPANDQFLLVATPAAAFQLPLVPTTILYSPLGNGKNASSSFTLTNITGINQQFTSSNGQTQGFVFDDKTQYQGSVTLSLSAGAAGKAVCGDKNCKLQVGYSASGAWDDSTEKDNETDYGANESIVTQNQTQITHTVVPSQNRPPLDQTTWATQPFWDDVILAVTNAQYAVWDYPEGAIIQPLGSVSVAELPVRQLDHCANSPNAAEPTSITPEQWISGHVYAPGTVLLDSNNYIQVATTGGTSGANVPSWNASIGSTTSDGTVIWTNEQDQYGVYKGSVAQNATQFLLLNTWKVGHAYSVGDVIVGITGGIGSIEVATTDGTSGTTAPAWNTADEGVTADGTVTWTNEQEHFTVPAGPVSQRQSVYHWLTSDTCKDMLSLDQFYANKVQSAAPIAYRVLGPQLSLAPPSNPVTFSNQNQTVSSAGTGSSAKHTVKVTSIVSNSESVSGGIDFGFIVGYATIGIGGSGSWTQNLTTTTSNTTVDSNTLQTTLTATGQATAATTIQDTGSEQSIPANVVQDSIFMGVAVQDPSMHPIPPGASSPANALSTSATSVLPAELQGLQIVPIGRSPAILRNGSSPEPSTYLLQTNYGFLILVKKPPNVPEIKAQHEALHAAAAHRHLPRPMPHLPPPSVSAFQERTLH